MKVLITGGTGFIGSILQTYLLHYGCTVHYLTKSPDKIVTNDNVKGFLWDTNKKHIDPKAFDGVDCIVNLAGKSINCKWNEKNKAGILQSRLHASQTLYDYLKNNKHSIRQIVNASAIGIYTSSYHKLYTEDENNFNQEFLGEVCVAWEKANQRFESIGINTAIIRIGLVLSRDNGALPEMTQLVKYGIGRKMGSGQQMYSWIHIDDLIRMIYFLMENDLGGVYNAVSPSPITQETLNSAIAKQQNSSFIIPTIPQILFKLGLGERSALILDSQKVSSKKISEKGFVFDFIDIHSALRNIYK